jgi:hypothetical protein
MKIRFTNVDCQLMEALGIEPADVCKQIGIFGKSNISARLIRPCTLGDGVWKIEETEAERFLELHREAALKGRFMKFVPASGAATRMFQSLLQIYYLPQFLEKDELLKKVDQGVAIACDFVRFMEGLNKFAFLDDLIEALARDGLDLGEIIGEGRYRLLLDYLLTDRGLSCGVLPKALLKFHSYPEQNENRTAFEEQMVESFPYLGTESGKCRLHFTIPVEYENAFRTLLEKARKTHEERYHASFEISFSFQKPSTHTIAVDMDGLPFRDRFGRLHFRPAGHGALLENLNDLQADIIYIKNIDNIVRDRFKEPVVYWKKVLGGYLVSIQQEVHSFLQRMKEPDSDQAVREAARFAARELHWDFPEGFDSWPEDTRRRFLTERLDRPVRVCGVVPNAGEPGGAPFWVEDETGVSVQIVEKAQVDFSSMEQQKIWNSSTHFNPVDIVCGTRDFLGKPYDLRKFVNRDAVIITKKSKDGKDIQALELPGLWNGSMARWITVIVEVPPITFNPVKSVYDLLRPGHQPEIPSSPRLTQLSSLLPDTPENHEKS